MVTVAMIAMMKNNPTTKTLSKVTTSIMTTMTIVLHRELENDWSSFALSTVQFACNQCVSRCCCLLLAYPRNSSFPTLVCQILPYWCAYILGRAYVFGIVRPRGTATRSFRNCAVARNPSNLLLFWVFAILPTFCSVDLFAVFFKVKL